jgi:hypothetical protein
LHCNKITYDNNTLECVIVILLLFALYVELQQKKQQRKNIHALSFSLCSYATTNHQMTTHASLSSSSSSHSTLNYNKKNDDARMTRERSHVVIVILLFTLYVELPKKNDNARAM